MESNYIYITGASGLLGRYLISELINNSNYKIVALTSCPEKLKDLLKDKKNKITYSNYKSFLSNKVSKEQLCNGGGDKILIHSAFTRKNKPTEIKKALDLTKDIFQKCREMQFQGVLNISSRSVYKEPEIGTLNNEASPLLLKGLISIGKYTTELLAKSYFEDTLTQYSNLRIASINELKLDNNIIRPLNVFVDCVINGCSIHIKGGNQIMSYIAPQDVASAIHSLLKIYKKGWKDIYNIGTGWFCTEKIINLAHLVNERALKFGYSKVDVEIENIPVNQTSGLDISRIIADTGWQPKISLCDMIDSLYEIKIKNLLYDC